MLKSSREILRFEYMKVCVIKKTCFSKYEQQKHKSICISVQLEQQIYCSLARPGIDYIDLDVINSITVRIERNFLYKKLHPNFNVIGSITITFAMYVIKLH